MASFEDQNNDTDTGFLLVQRKNMRRGNKPVQQIYRPGSGPLRKSNTGIEESESDTNIVINSRQIQSKHLLTSDDIRHRSEGNSPRDKIFEMDNPSSRVGDVSFNQDFSRRQKKPEQMHYVPRPLLAQGRELNPTQDFNRNHSPTNGNENPRFGGNSKNKRYFDRNREDTFQDEWRDNSSPLYRPRHGSEPRGVNHGSTSVTNYYRARDRDSRSVEPSGVAGRSYNTEKIQSKPPSGRRHSTIGLEPEKRHKFNIDNLPPRLKKKILAEMASTPEENWDGTSLTFQGHSGINNPSFHQMGATYNTLPSNQNVHNQLIGNSGYHTLPSRPRGRGRLQQEYENLPGQMYRSMTPDRIRSPCNSRPPTPPLSGSRPHTPVSSSNDHCDSRNYQDKYRNTHEDRYRNSLDQSTSGRQKEVRSNIGPKGKMYDNRKHADFNRDRDRDYRGDNRRNEDGYNRGKGRMQDNYKREKETPNRETPSNTRKNNNKRDGGGSYRDRRRDNRREREVHSASRDYNSTASNVNLEENLFDNVEIIVAPVKDKLPPSLEAQLSPVSPATPEEIPLVTLKLNLGPILDWSEEVELNDRLEAEALSDALTRSSSITSLQEVSAKTVQQAPINSTPGKRSKRRNRRSSKNRSGTRDGSTSRTRNDRIRQDSTTSVDSKDIFKVPKDNFPRRRGSRDRRDKSYDRFHGSKNPSREGSWDRNRVSRNGTENWRDEMVRSRQNSEKGELNSEDVEKGVDATMKKPGIIVLPHQKSEPAAPPSLNNVDHPRYLNARKSPSQQKSLFDPNNPNKPIIVKPTNSRIAVPGFSDNAEVTPPEIQTTDQYGNVRPSWYDESMESFKSSHFPDLLRDIKKADTDLQYIINSGSLLVKWDVVDNLRQFLKEALQFLLCKAIKFSQVENVEQHFWKILYHNIIEVTRNAISNDLENKENYKTFLLYLIDEGTKYFEGLLNLLEVTYNFKLNDYLGPNSMVSHKGLGLVGMALVCAQKLFLFLGDLGRYREQVNETSNYGKCRQWYIKSHEINPKNGKPYNQLALLAVYARRKLDAVYYYMRSLMSSNPVPSARENLISLFDENRKKYEQGERKRRDERLARQRQQMKQKESENSGNVPGSLRKETWIHPEGGRRVHRTTLDTQDQKDSEEEDLTALSSVEVNKRFVISYLHVHGKLITKIGMETFQETSMQMLREFRALLQHSPVPLPCNRFLQLLALNMFAIESTQLKDPQQLQAGYRSELQEKALIISLQMFNLILERCVSILQEHVSSSKDININSLPQDANVLLPAIKVWCDWMQFHTNDWNPPPSTQDFRVGAPGDAWSRLATLMNLLEQMDHSVSNSFAKAQQEGYESIKLPEDGVLSGFTPLMYTVSDPTYAPKELDSELTHFALRLSKLLFFGTVYLCGVDPPVLKLEIEDDTREYVSVVSTSSSRDSPPSPRELASNNDILLEGFSDDEDEGLPEENITTADAPTEIRSLLTRKVELEKRKRSQDLHMQRVKKILSLVVSVHMEVRPKYLVPDTNCFIDHLDGIRTIAQSHCYTLMVPIVVLSELEGLSRGGKTPAPDSRSFLDPQHVKKVADSAKNALEFLRTRHSSVKCVTTKGAIIPSTRFSTEDDTTWDNSLKNDDKILTTCLVLCKGHKDKEQPQEVSEGEPRQLVREVVLITEDRNLRVKAYARDVPVRELPDFMRWAGLG